MQLAFSHCAGLLFAVGIVFLGRSMILYPERTVRFFHFGQEPAFGKRLGMAWARASGRFFLVFGALGCLLFLIYIPIDLSKR